MALFGLVGQAQASPLHEISLPSQPSFMAPAPDGSLYVQSVSDIMHLRGGRLIETLPLSALAQTPLATVDTVTNTAGTYVADLTGGAITRSDGAAWRLAGDRLAFPVGLAQAPDGSIWCAAYHELCRISPNGTLTQYPLPGTQHCMLFASTCVGGYADARQLTIIGNDIYFVTANPAAIGRSTPDGKITMLPLKDTEAVTIGIASVGGVLYVGEANASKLAKLNPSAFNAKGESRVQKARSNSHHRRHHHRRKRQRSKRR